eukprot:COSAG06_NODE_7_length_38054_cov_37.302569_4_plen_59_part_00
MAFSFNLQGRIGSSAESLSAILACCATTARRRRRKRSRLRLRSCDCGVAPVVDTYSTR